MEFDHTHISRHDEPRMSIRTLPTALVEAETAYLEAMIRHERERSLDSYREMSNVAHRLEALELLEAWWSDNLLTAAANTTLPMEQRYFRPTPRG